MSWRITDEHIDLARCRHVVIFKNHDTGGEHHLVYEFKLNACAHCGRPQDQIAAVDFDKVKADTLESLNAHHNQVMEYRAKHPRVRVLAGVK